MFARRKGKDPEDEPLVPHGFLWQATDGPEDESKAASAPSTPAQPLEMPLRQEVMPNFRAPVPPVQESESKPAIPGNEKMGAISPPIAWPSPKTTSVIRRVAPAKVVPPQAPVASMPHQVEAPREVQPISPQSSRLTPAPKVGNHKIEIIELGNSDVEIHSRRRESLQHFLRSLRKHYENNRKQLSRLSTSVGDRARLAIRSIDAPGRIRRIKPLAENCARALSTGSRVVRQSSVSKWNSISPRIAAYGSQLSRSASSAARISAATTAEFARSVRKHRVRVRVANSRFAQELIRRGKLAWSVRQNAFRREPRLWTSMAMAALSALLTMGLISGLHRYGVDANVQNGEAGTPRPAAPAALMAPATALADTGVRVSHPRVKKAVSKASPVRNQSASAVEVHKRQARGRAHHSSDEDYIAPDTYHYYGNRGSR